MTSYRQYVVFLVRPIIYLISSIDMLSKTTCIYTFKLTLYVNQKLRYREINFVFLAAILKIQNSGPTGIYANVNIDFRIPDAISFPKMCYIANLHKIWQKYIVNLTRTCIWKQMKSLSEIISKHTPLPTENSHQMNFMLGSVNLKYLFCWTQCGLRNLD